MEGLVKIGTTEQDLVARMRALSQHTGVPGPFECFYAVQLSEAVDLERALHSAFQDVRLPGREFFELAPDRPAALMKEYVRRGIATVVTPNIEVVENRADEQNLERGRRRAPNFAFEMAGVPEGAELVSTFNDTIRGIAHGRRSILVNGERLSLSLAAVRVAQQSGYGSTSLQGPAYWTYGGRTLLELRQEREGDPEFE
jgi:hypothetical protein